MTKDQALKELSSLQMLWRDRQINAESDGNTDYATLDGAISAIDVAIDIVKEIE